MGFSALDIILTCEHSSDKIPEDFLPFFHRSEWEEHEIFDIGALNLAAHLADKFDLPMFQAEVSRLVIDLNRSSSHPAVSKLLKKPTPDSIANLIKSYHAPFRKRVHNFVKGREKTLHIGVHSFTRNFNGIVRDADIGILYDPKSPEEKAFAGTWIRELKKSDFKVKANYPYKGSSDGHTTELRKIFPSHQYLGFELEICNDILTGGRKNELYKTLTRSMKS